MTTNAEFIAASAGTEHHRSLAIVIVLLASEVRLGALCDERARKKNGGRRGARQCEKSETPSCLLLACRTQSKSSYAQAKVFGGGGGTAWPVGPEQAHTCRTHVYAHV